MTAINYARAACDTIMKTYDAPALPPEGRFHYQQGVFLSGMEQVYLATGEEKYYTYIKDWVDSIVISDATIRFHFRDKLDDLQPARLLFLLYDKTGAAHYRTVLDHFADYLRRWDFTAEGGFWHMHNKPHQMWLDGLYMAGSLLMPYAARFGQPDLFDLMDRQVDLMFRYLRDERTGLLYHACDFSRQMNWSDPVTGLSPEFWGRAIGWVGFSLVDMLDFLPQKDSRREKWVSYLTGLLKAVAVYQHPVNGLWYQVVDKGNICGNWTETSCSALFTYAIAKAVRKGYLEMSYKACADRGYQGVIQTLEMRDSELYLPCICTGTGVGDYQHYINRPKEINDMHGMGAFVLMCCEYQRLL